MANTGEIQSFLITEESGIAKGIRRLVAVTGDESRLATARANDCMARFETITRLPAKEKVAALKVFDVVCPSPLSAARADNSRHSVLSILAC